MVLKKRENTVRKYSTQIQDKIAVCYIVTLPAFSYPIKIEPDDGSSNGKLHVLMGWILSVHGT